jgi:hypothetical protein
MKRTIFAGASLFLAASVLAMACGGKDPPPQQPQGFYGQAGGYGYPPGQDPNAQGYNQQPGYNPQQPGAYPPPGAPPPGAPGAPGSPSGDGTAAFCTCRNGRSHGRCSSPRAAARVRRPSQGHEGRQTAIGGMLQEGASSQEFMLMPGKCYTVLGQRSSAGAELDLH